MAACSHGMPTPASCVTCMEEGPVGPPRVHHHPPEVVELTLQARYAGHCNGCNLPIRIGQVVHRLDSGRYVHMGCQP